MSKELYEATIEYTKEYNGESWVATISDEKYIDMDTFERTRADLEAKLAEKEQIIETQYNGIEYWKSVAEKRPDFDCVVKIKELEQQLAEKDKELRGKETLNQIFKDNRENKISFALEQLEKVKNGIESKVESIYKRLDALNIKIVCESTSRELSIYEETVKIIDNQIKQLKEGK